MNAPRRFTYSFFLAVGVALAAPASAQFDYTLSLDTDAARWSVEATFENPGGGDVDFWIARWTPGAYHVADYARFIDSFEARSGDGSDLAVERVSDSHFRIATSGAERIVVAYEADSISNSQIAEGMILDVESNRVNERYAYVNPVSLFGFVPGRLDEPYSLSIDLPEGWKAATALKPNAEGAYAAESYYRLEDSPIFMSPDHTTVVTKAGGRPLEVTVYGRSGDELDELVEGCRKIVEAAASLMGGLPYDEYEFLLGFVPEAGGSGLEHSFSTLILLNDGSPADAAWGIIAHEFVHLWCAERIHVEGIHDPEYREPFVTGTIWVNESVTEYMTQHVLYHAGIFDESDFFSAVGPDQMIDRMASQLGAPTAVSRAAGGWESMQDLMTFAMKMYMQGPRIVLALDMEMRRASSGERGVVDMLRHLMSEYVAEDKGFPEDGMLEIINEVAGGDLAEFYERFIDGSEHPNFDEHLDVIGCEIVDGAVVVIEEPSDAQQAAYADFFSIQG